MKKTAKKTALEWMYNKLVCTPDLTVYECTETLKTAKDMQDKEQVEFLQWLRANCRPLRGGWDLHYEIDLCLYTDIGVYELYKSKKK